MKSVNDLSISTKPFLRAGVLGAAMLAAALSACSPRVHTHGFSPRGAELDGVKPQQDTRASVERKLGRPSTVASFDDATWYYISVKTEAYAFFEPEIVEQRVITVSFDENNRVTNVGRYGLEDGQVIELVSRTTPTSGAELTILQQIFANLGRFQTDKAVTNPAGGGGF